MNYFGPIRQIDASFSLLDGSQERCRKYIIVTFQVLGSIKESWAKRHGTVRQIKDWFGMDLIQRAAS